ncbi:MAG TPA: hypothetical protein VF631_01805 [Allosphingosinicella sp.]|jgi:hypothetical protein|uniref:hypothetical protein n=1 Tax=Allosphingosinicella sp. TaxID=2823234 RepID=UPI002F2A9338
MRWVALPLLLFALAACGEAPGARAAPDGNWTVLSIDGQPVPPGSYELRVRRGRVTGGRDGSNGWGYVEDQPPRPDGSRMIISDLQGCAETPERTAYWRAINNGESTPTPQPGGRIALAAQGNRLVAVPSR